MTSYPVAPDRRAVAGGRFRLLPWSVGLGALLLAVSAGTSWLVMHAPLSAQEKGNGAYRQLDQRAVAVAFVDVEGGVVNLYPVRQGRIVELPVKEDVEVEAGTPLLKIDDELAKIQQAEAELALEAAKKRKELAQSRAEQHDKQVAAQEAAVEAARSKVAAANAQADKVRRYHRERLGGSTEDVKAAEKVTEEAQAGVKAEQAKVEVLRAMKPRLAVDMADVDVRAKQQDVEKAKLGVRECVVRAPRKGKVLRKFVSVGEVLGANPKLPALQFCPSEERIIRAEVEQEFASRVSKGMKARIHDDATGGGEWQGEVIRVSDWYTQRRSVTLEPLQFNDVRTLEVIIRVKPDAKNPLRIGQRMRVMLEGSK
jgi:multidrug resistance efflux pump